MTSGDSLTLWGRSYGHRRGRDSVRRGIGTIARTLHIRFTGNVRESRRYRIIIAICCHYYYYYDIILEFWKRPVSRRFSNTTLSRSRLINS